MIVTIGRNDVKALLLAESTNAARTAVRGDGVSDFERVVIGDQEDEALNGTWMEACSVLAEKMDAFLDRMNLSDAAVRYNFEQEEVPDGLAENLKMYIVDRMMADWLAQVRPDYRILYVERAANELDDALRKLYRKKPPV